MNIKRDKTKTKPKIKRTLYISIYTTIYTTTTNFKKVLKIKKHVAFEK